jgi:hypothetical protein
MSLGPAQISRPFFDREIAPLVPGASYPESIVTVPSALHLIQVWASKRVAQYILTEKSESKEAYRLALLDVFDHFHGYADPVYRAVGLYIAANRCRP